jgi:quercetin dioxygenase-like cupin family protein
MVVIRKHEQIALETPGGNQTSGIATPEHGAREVSVIRQIQQPGGHNPPHYHDREEVLILCTGQVQVTVEQTTVELAAGDSLVVPAGVLHQLANTGAAPAEWLLIAASPVRFFRPGGEELFPEWAR